MSAWWRSAALAASTMIVAVPAGARELVVGKPMPAIELTLIDGTKVQTHDLRGQAVVLNFWAT